MKFHRVIFLLVLIALIWGGAHEKAVIARLQTEHDTLVARATAIGLPEKEGDAARATARTTGRPPSTKLPAEHLKDELVSAYHRLKDLENSQDPETRLKVEAEVREWIGRLIDLSPKELKRMIADLNSDPSLDPKEVRELVSVALNLAAARQPETAAELALANRDGSPDIRGIIRNWAGQEPAAAFAWLEENKEAIGKEYNKAWEDAVKESASRDPKLALQELSKIHSAGVEEVARGLTENLRDPSSRAAFVEELRNSHLDGAAVFAWSGLGRSLSKQSPEESSAILKSLSPTEADMIAGGISSSNEAVNHAGAWLDWMGKSLPPEKVPDTASPMLTRWINDDYEAAGEWINRQPAGEFRNAAAANYARMMAKRFPDTARDWAATLPEGPEKQRLLDDLQK